MVQDIPQPLWIASIFCLGLVLGSFATALTYRIPRNIPWAFKAKQNKEGKSFRSCCTSCQTTLKPRDLIPFFSWAFARGKCRYCGVPIGITYPFVELGVCVFLLFSFFVFGPSIEFLVIFITLPFLAALTAIDIQKMILPNQLVLTISIIGFIYQCLRLAWGNITGTGFLLEYILGALIYGGSVWLVGAIMSKILKRNALGFGDVKLFSAIGLWLGTSQIGLFFFLSGVCGIALSVLWEMFARKHTKTGVFPFGPAIILSFFLLFHLDGSKILGFILK